MTIAMIKNSLDVTPKAMLSRSVEMRLVVRKHFRRFRKEPRRNH